VYLRDADKYPTGYDADDTVRPSTKPDRNADWHAPDTDDNADAN